MTIDERAVRNDLSGLWQMLEKETVRDLKQAKTNLNVGARKLGVAIDVNGARYLIIPCTQGVAREGLWRGAVVVLDSRNLVGSDGATGTWLVLKCLDPALEEVFLRLAANICVAVAGKEENATLAACIVVLESWRELVGAVARPVLSRQAVAGILGELIVLRRLADFDHRLALRAWQGPLGGRHDFRYGASAIEAKATLSRTGRFISINGHQQLDAPDGGQLHLSWARFEYVPGGPLSLSGMVEEIISKGVDGDALKALLVQLGYDASTSSEGAEATFDLREWVLWNVDKTFPKIVSGSFSERELPAGVISLKYMIDCSSIPEMASAECNAYWSGFFES